MWAGILPRILRGLFRGILLLIGRLKLRQQLLNLVHLEPVAARNSRGLFFNSL